MEREVSEERLWEAARSGCGRAREALITLHEYLVPSTLRGQLYRAPTRLREDLLACGRLGLVKAVDRYEPGRGVTFTTWAIHLIWGEMVEELRRQDWVPRSVRMAEKRGEPVTILAQISLEAIAYSDGENDDLTRLNRLSDWQDTPDVIVPRRLEAEIVATLVRCLPWRQRKVLVLSYWHDLTLPRIGERMGLSSSRVHQLKEQAEAFLRLSLEEYGAHPNP